MLNLVDIMVTKEKLKNWKKSIKIDVTKTLLMNEIMIL